MDKKKSYDNNNRLINYLRLSITDRCNLRCIYCMPEEGVRFLPHEKIMSFEELIHIIRLAVEMGIRKVRVTGGEPLVRKDFVDFLNRMNNIEGLEEITLTTNGVLLKEYASGIKAAGIHRINISLDSLKPERFFRITGRDFFRKVWDGIEEAERLGFDPIKINVVAIKGINDDEIMDFTRLTLEKPYHIRFIEYMPIGGVNTWKSENFISSGEISNIIEAHGPLTPIEKRNSLDGPAQRFVYKNGKGEIGLIGALSNHFCEICNRLRLTAEGHLRGCLFLDDEIDIKTPLREGRDDQYLLGLIEKAIKEKPKGHGIIKLGRRVCVRHMSSIGG
ncbi:MAG: GTP 3',8-cyclase MoaA [Deltaproteobacteria bacterium]|nr:GTP 3',8-cyclase MoaA [Deltaproteobacteria bacterium]